MAVSLPDRFAQIPRFPLSYQQPSPIHPISQLGQPPSKTRQVFLFVKREDHSSPLACAGNKYRKLEYIIPDILGARLYPDVDANIVLPGAEEAGSASEAAKKTTILVTEGAVQSNHTVQVSAVATRLGLESAIVLHRGLGGGLARARDPAAFVSTGNVQIERLLGAQMHFVDKSAASGQASQDPIASLLQDLLARGHMPYWIPSGASLHPLGGLGYARCAFEIAAQEREAQLKGSGRFDYIFVACGSGGTVGGLIAGIKLLEKAEAAESTERNSITETEINSTASSQTGLHSQSRRQRPRKVIGVLISPTKPRAYHEERVLRFARQAGKLIGLDPEQDLSMQNDVHLEDRFAGSAYGVLEPDTTAVLERFARGPDSLILDPVYTVKAARAMLHWVESGEIAADWVAQAPALNEEQAADHSSSAINVLFLHTGGQTALSAYADIA